VVRRKTIDLSEEHVASTFRVEELSGLETSLKVDPVDGGGMFLRIVD
jgi:hypothetical protein